MYMSRSELTEETKKDSPADMVAKIRKHLEDTIDIYKKEIKPNAVFAWFGKQHAIGHGDALAKIHAATELLNGIDRAENDNKKLANLLGGIQFFINQGGFFGDTLAEKLVAKKDSVFMATNSFSEGGEEGQYTINQKNNEPEVVQTKFEPAYLTRQTEVSFTQEHLGSAGTEHGGVEWTNYIDRKKEYEKCVKEIFKGNAAGLENCTQQQTKTTVDFNSYGKPQQQEMKELPRRPF